MVNIMSTTKAPRSSILSILLGRGINTSALAANFNIWDNYPDTGYLAMTPAPTSIMKTGEIFGTYIRVIIVVLGLLGNTVSLRVFLSKHMRGLSAACYLAAIAVADNLTLLFYLLPDVLWITDLPFLNKHGVCHVMLYMKYLSRFLAVWLIVCFTVERYLGVTKPLERRSLASVSGSLKVIGSLTSVGVLVSLYRPLMSVGGAQPCYVPVDQFLTTFILDLIYMCCITVVPCIIITILNLLIVRRLCLAKHRQQELLMTEENHLRLEFTGILLAVSFCFILFNIPHLVVWARNWLQQYETVMFGKSSEVSFEDRFAQTQITKTVFGMNYCINFFLYSVSGVYFRQQLKALVEINHIRSRFWSRSSNTTDYSHVPNRNSPV